MNLTQYLENLEDYGILSTDYDIIISTEPPGDEGDRVRLPLTDQNVRAYIFPWYTRQLHADRPVLYIVI